MKQLVQDLRSGELLLLDVPAPQPGTGQVLIKTSRSLISAGTERMLTSFAKAGYLQKARLQPDKVKQVLEKVRTDGLWSTIESVRSRLEQPIELGYCNVGRVVAVGEGVTGISVGDRVVSNSPHAELVVAPKNLCVRVPEGVTDDQAAFAVVSAIGLQGVRLIAPTIGEVVVVCGLGLIGLLSAQILRSAGCRVIGFDPDAKRVNIANGMGVEALRLEPDSDPASHVHALTGGAGADAVMITASTSDDSLISQCAAMCRKRGRIVLTGVIGLNLKRADFYEKELTFQVSCSYGPGRYDPDYEGRGIDYPRAFVRWTAGRNFEAVLDLMRDGRLSMANLITDRAPFGQVADAYGRLSDAGAIGILLEYDDNVDDRRSVANQVEWQRAKVSVTNPAIAVIGAGQFAQGRILPALTRAGASVRVIASAQGISAAIASRRFRIPVATTDVDAVLRDDTIAAVVIATRHDQHASLAIRALQAGKHVFVEKPLCITEDELASIASARREIALRDGTMPAVVVGFNRRHAPLARRMQQAMSTRTTPAFVTYTCNAGALPPDHWAHNPGVGGGRIIGEACHFIDFIQFLVGSRIVSVRATKFRPGPGDLEDNVAITLGFDDGSVGQVNYFACGNRAYPKERCEAAYDSKCLALDNFRGLTGYGISVSARNFRQDKGHDQQFAAFARLVAGGELAQGFPVPFETVQDVMLATFLAVRSMRE